MNSIKVSVKDRIGIVTLARPEKRNALNGEMVIELKSVFDDLHSKKEVKIVVLRAEGKAFCSGADLEYLQNLRGYTDEENLEDSRRLGDLLLTIYTFKKTVVAEVQGPAIAGGAGLVSVCDFAFGTDKTLIGYPEVKIGFVPAIVMPFLLRKLPESYVRNLFLSGELLQAELALKLGLLYKVVAQDNLHHEVLKFARSLCTENSTKSMSITKKLLSTVPSIPLEEAVELACRTNAEARTTSDFFKGTSDFLAKKDIKW